MNQVFDFITNHKIATLAAFLLVAGICLSFAKHHRKHGHHHQNGGKHYAFANDQSGQLVHTVLFKLKPDADKAAMIKSLETLRSIKVVNKVEIGEFLNTGNPTSLSDYTIIMTMTLDNIEAFRVYEKDATHLASIAATKDLLAGAPIGYDYLRNK